MPILSAEERIGTTVDDRYRLHRIRATGGMGVVYEGEHLVTGRPVAVKMLRPQFVHVREAVARFFREARAAASLSHPNIIDVIDMGQCDDGSAYQVLELLDGESLAVHMNRNVRLDPGWLLDVLLPVMDALQSAHFRGVVHRDLKPDNIFVATNSMGDLVPKVLDFGIAKLADARSSGASAAGAILGTPQYMSPEQASGRANVGAVADIWALGMVLLEGLCGHVPIQEENPTTLLIRLATRGAPAAREVCPELHPSLAAVIDTALAHSPDARWKSMSAFANALNEAASRASIHLSYIPMSRRGHELPPSGAMPIARAKNRISEAPDSSFILERVEGFPSPSGRRASRGKASGQRVTVVRPYGHVARNIVSHHLSSAGYVVEEQDVIAEGTADEEAISRVLQSSNKVLLVPFHGHKDGQGQRVDGLNFIRKLDRAAQGRFRWRIIMPTSALGAASVTLALSREPMRPAVKRAILVVHEDELNSGDLGGRIQAHVCAA